MINEINYLRMKNILLKNYKNVRVCVQVRGVINTKLIIEKSRITINRNKMIISNEDIDFTLEFMEVKKIKLCDIFHLEFHFENIVVNIEI